MRLNVGCGRSIMEGWTNVDVVPLPGVDVVYDLERPGGERLPLEDDSVDEFLLSHVIEHVRNSLGLMEELHRVARPGARMVIRVPHGASDDAHEDPTHVRCYFPGSFGYFGQPYYWRADYGYRGDWLTEGVDLHLVDGTFAAEPLRGHAWRQVECSRNVVREMVARLVAVKPIRDPKRELQVVPRLTLCP